MHKSHEASLHVLHVAPNFYPANRWGGPIFSNRALCDGLAYLGDISLSVLTTDSAAPGSRPRLALGSNPRWFDAGYGVRYCRRLAGNSVSLELLARLLCAMRNADIVHLHYTYSFPTLPVLLLARILAKPVIWSPHGALQATEEWPDAPRQRTKRAFERLCQLLRPNTTVLHVTAPMEAEASRARLLGVRTVVIPNIVYVSETLCARQWRPGGQLRLMFLGRLHPQKGIGELLRAMALVPSHVTLDIYGSGAEQYEIWLHRRVAELSLTQRVSFHGHTDGAAKKQAFAKADALVLPSYSESFGIAVGEALAHGVPAITTTGAPWEGLETECCGLWISPGVDTLVEALVKLERLDLAAMGQRGREWMRRDYSESVVVNAMLELYSGLAKLGKIPAADE